MDETTRTALRSMLRGAQVKEKQLLDLVRKEEAAAKGNMRNTEVLAEIVGRVSNLVNDIQYYRGIIDTAKFALGMAIPSEQLANMYGIGVFIGPGNQEQGS